MDDNFSPRVKDVIAYSKEEALRLGHDFIGTEHLNAWAYCAMEMERQLASSMLWM